MYMYVTALNHTPVGVPAPGFEHFMLFLSRPRNPQECDRGLRLLG